MRSPDALLAAAALAAAMPTAPLSAQTVVELRASTTKYRFLDVSHTFANRVVLDLLHVGVPGMNELASWGTSSGRGAGSPTTRSWTRST